MAHVAEETGTADGHGPLRTLRRQVRIPVPDWVGNAVGAGASIAAGRIVTTTARVLTIVIPTAIAVAGLAIALVASILSERGGTEAIGTLGVELGAAMWFAGAVTLGGRPRPTVLRLAVLAMTGIIGLALIGTALVAGWSGAALGLAMEFGVGAVAIVVLDVVILGVIQSRLDQLATTRHVASTSHPRFS